MTYEGHIQGLIKVLLTTRLFIRTFQASNNRKKFNDFQGPVEMLKQKLLLAYALLAYLLMLVQTRGIILARV